MRKLANPGSPGRMVVKLVCVCVCYIYSLILRLLKIKTS